MEEIVAAYGKGVELQPKDIAFLELLKDELVHMAAPATRLTIAYTVVVVGGGQQKGERERPKDRVDYAQSAYPALLQAARWHRWGHNAIIGFALALALITVSESARVALGRALLQTRQELRTQQAAIAAEKLQIQTANGDVTRWRSTLPMNPEKPGISGVPQDWNFDYCEYARALARMNGSTPGWPHSDNPPDNAPPLRAYFSRRPRNYASGI